MCIDLYDDDQHSEEVLGSLDIHGSIAQLLFVLIAFEDAQGALTFLVFGMPDEVGDVVRHAVSRLFTVCHSAVGGASASCEVEYMRSRTRSVDTSTFVLDGEHGETGLASSRAG